MIERRAHKRVPISGIAVLQYTKKGKLQSIRSVTANISFMGIGLYSYDPVGAGIGVSVAIAINFISKGGTLKKDSVKGTVVSNKKIEDTYFIGIKLHEEIDAENHPSLYDHIQQIGSWEKE